MKSTFSFCYFSVLFLSVLSLSAQESWHQFRGNNRNGSSVNTSINKEWSDSGPSLLWKKNIGEGFSEILVAENKVFTMTGEKADSLSGSEYMVAYNSKTGEEIWKTLIDSMIIDPDGAGDGPRSTPALDKKTVYCLSSYGKLKALSVETGEILWTVDFRKEFDNKPGWNYTTSPVLHENELIIEVGGTEQS